MNLSYLCPSGGRANSDFPLIMRWAIGRFSLSGRQEGWRRHDLRERQDRFAVREVSSGLSCRGRLEVLSQRLKWLTRDEADPVSVEHRRAPGDDLGRRQIALPERLRACYEL